MEQMLTIKLSKTSVIGLIILLFASNFYAQNQRIVTTGNVLKENILLLNGKVEQDPNNKCIYLGKALTLLTAHGIVAENHPGTLGSLIQQSMEIETAIRQYCGLGVGIAPNGSFTVLAVGGRTINIRNRDVDLMTLALMFMDTTEREAVFKEISAADVKLAVDLRNNLEKNKDLFPTLNKEIEMFREEKYKQVITNYLDSQINTLKYIKLDPAKINPSVITVNPATQQQIKSPNDKK